MDLKDMHEKYKKGNQLLFSRDSACLQELLHLICLQKHRTLVFWAMDCAQKPLALLRESWPEEERPAQALRASFFWAQGKIKMPAARKAILQAHAAAKKRQDPAGIALCHGIGQACGTVHTETHAIGLPIYELTAIVRRLGPEHCEEAIQKRLEEYSSCLLHWEKEIDAQPRCWAAFLADDSRPNKERLRYVKSKSRETS